MVVAVSVAGVLPASLSFSLLIFSFYIYFYKNILNAICYYPKILRIAAMASTKSAPIVTKVSFTVDLWHLAQTAFACLGIGFHASSTAAILELILVLMPPSFILIIIISLILLCQK